MREPSSARVRVTKDGIFLEDKSGFRLRAIPREDLRHIPLFLVSGIVWDTPDEDRGHRERCLAE